MPQKNPSKTVEIKRKEKRQLAIVTKKKFMTGICEGLHSNVRQFDVISGKGKFGRGRQIKQ